MMIIVDSSQFMHLTNNEVTINNAHKLSMQVTAVSPTQGGVMNKKQFSLKKNPDSSN